MKITLEQAYQQMAKTGASWYVANQLYKNAGLMNNAKWQKRLFHKVGIRRAAYDLAIQDYQLIKRFID